MWPPTQTFQGVCHAFLRDEPLRTSAWEATVSLKRMEARDLSKQEIDLIHCQSNDSRPTYREQYTINDTFANRRKL